MIVHVVLALVSLGVLSYAADHLVLGSSRLAVRLRIRPVVVGVIVIGLGTSAPELLVSGVAAARGDTGIAMGNIAGSNILNLTMILGLAGVIAPFAVASRVIRREVRLSVVATAVFGVLAWLGLSVWTGVVLTALGVGAGWLLLRWATAEQDVELVEEVQDFAAGRRPGDAAGKEAVRTVLGLVGVLVGAQLLVTNAGAVAEQLGVPQLIIGITLVAVGTSLPELVTTVQAMRRGETDLVVGNLFGSNLFNSLAGGAVIAWAAPGGVRASLTALLVLTMILTGVLAWALLRRGLTLTRTEGVILIAVYAVVTPFILVG